MHKLRALFFDMGGVLIRLRKDRSPDAKVDRLETIICSELNAAVAQRIARLELGLLDEEFERALDSVAEKYDADERLWRILAEWRCILKTAILNNGSSIALSAFDRRFGIFSAVDLFLNSAIEGISKPDPRFFKIACDRLNVMPEECLFVDDVRAHIEAASSLGMRTIHWNDPTGCYEELVAALPDITGQCSD
jgi:HAD superfamily hydrolase (TIGR01509 family)